MTRGTKSSEYKSLRTCFYCCFLLTLYTVYKDRDLGDLAILLPALCSPIMFYAGCRTHVKGKNGETEI